MKILLTVLYMAVIGQVCFFFGLSLPREKFNENRFPYKTYSWEKGGKLYNIVHVKKWKSRVPDMSTLTNKLMPKKVNLHITAADVDRLIKESCVAELIHYLLCVFSIGIYNIWEDGTGIVLAVLYVLFGNVPYIIIQRYNRPNFISLRDRLKIREERNANG